MIRRLWTRLVRAVEPTTDAHRGLALIEDQADHLRRLRGPKPPALVVKSLIATATNIEPAWTYMGETGRAGRRALVHAVGSAAHDEWAARELAAFVRAMDETPDIVERLRGMGRLHVEPSWRELVGGAA